MINPYTIIGAIVLLITVALGGAHVGRKMERSSWQAKEIAAKERAALDLEIAHARIRRIQLSNEANARKASAQHEQAISDLTKQYDAARAAVRAAGGLRIPATVCPGSGADQGAGAGRSDDAPAATVALPERVTEDLFLLTKRADELSEQLRSLQFWVKTNGFYGEN